MNWSAVRQVVGNLVTLFGLFMLIPLTLAGIEGETTVVAFGVGFAVATLLGLALRMGAASTDIGTHEAFVIVSTGWCLVGLLGAIPFYFSGAFVTPVDAVFESVSGFTTTGATVLTNIEGQPRSILLWRALTQWLGGLGIVVLFISIFPKLGFGGIQLFKAEMSGLTAQKIRPRIRQTGRLLWGLYLGLTLVEFALLWLAGLSLFDAALHALTTISTGGFSTRNASVEAFANPAVEWIIALFMFLGGTSFVLLYRLVRHGEGRAVLRSREFQAYCGVTIVASLIVALSVWGSDYASFGDALRKATFQVVTILTTTGFSTANFAEWGTPALAVLFSLMFMGAMAGSTSGGPKLIRIVVAAQHAFLGFRRMLHPRAVTHVRLGDVKVSDSLTMAVGGFLFLYLLIWFVSFIVLTFLGLDVFDTASLAITSLGNIGPGFGTLGPTENFAFLPDAVKLFSALLMIVGRLEIYGFLMLFLPSFWMHK